MEAEGQYCLFDMCRKVFPGQDELGLQVRRQHIIYLFLASESLFRNANLSANSG